MSDKLRAAAIQAIALLDVAIAGTVFTKPDRGRVVVNVAKAQAVLDALRDAISSTSAPSQSPSPSSEAQSSGEGNGR